MLEELSKQDKKWRNMALAICGCKQLADDLVQEMYLKIYEKERITDYYVLMTLKSLYIDHIRQNKKIVQLDNFDWFEEEITITKERERINDLLNELPIVDREMLLITAEKSLRDNVAYFQSLGFEFSVMTFFYGKKKALVKLKKLYDERT